MPLLVIALFVAVPLAELYVIWQVGGLLGILPTLALLLGFSVLGGALLRAQGRAAWRRFVTTLQAGRPPAREVADGALIILGGALLLTPGFLTDAVGLAFLLPPTRALVRGTLVRRLAPRVILGTGARRRRPGPDDSRGPRGADVEGTATDVDDARERLHRR